MNSVNETKTEERNNLKIVALIIGFVAGFALGVVLVLGVSFIADSVRSSSEQSTSNTYTVMQPGGTYTKYTVKLGSSFKD